MSDATESDIEELPTDGEESFSSENLEEESSYGLEEEDEEELQEVLLSEDFISTPYLSENSTVPENIVEFNHSFGYECKKYFNLCAVDYKTLLFASGNILHFYDVEAKLLWFRRSSQGGGIGHITKSPCNPHFAVGEKGINPDIIIYEWPTMDIVAALRGGTNRSYTCLNYSPDGEYLCSQGGEPDYFLTVWNWRKSRILRQQRAYVQDVVNVMFSQYLTGRLTTGGAGHIKFWKMAKTFTGLKLMGVLGRFGKTEISDIIGFYPLPDEQVISGCQWGNMLLWNEGLIKLEVVGMGNNKCHKGPITQMFLDGKELVTVGRDGIINTWYYEIIDKADPTEEEFKLEMKPYYSFEIGSGPRKSDLIFIVKQFPEDPESTYWFAQFTYVSREIENRIDRERELTLNRHQKKLFNLGVDFNIDNETAYKKLHTFCERVVNLTEIELTKDEQNLLNKGLQYNLNPAVNSNTIKKTVAEVKIACDIANMNRYEQTNMAIKVKESIIDEMHSAHKNRNELTLKGLNKKLESRKAIVTKADKGGTMVLIHDTDYIEKTEKFFMEIGIVEVKKDPTKKFQTEIRKQIDNSVFLFTEEEKFKLKDANGRIWRIDLQRVGCKAPQEIFLSHAGAVVDMATSPIGPYIATLGSDGRLFVNNYLRKKLVLWKQFEIPGSCLLWVPLSLDRTGSILIVGMSDGVLRIVVVSAQEYEMYGGENQDAYVNLIETTKPHSKTITKITINKKGNLIVTGSEDATVFVYQIQRRRDVVALNPIGFVPTPGGVSYLGWKENEASTLMVGCSTGHYMEMILPERPVFYTKKTFRLRVESRVLQFKSVKSMIRREIKIKEIEAKKEKKLEKKREELRKMREENPHLDIDEETFFEDSESEEKLEPLYFPEVPNSVLFAVYVAPDIIWLSMGGYDAGYMYEYKFGEEDPVCSTMIADADDIEINYFLYSPDNQYVILGMQDGKIRINRVKPNYRDMTDYWLLSMHDNDNGVITRLCFSNDLSYMFSCGCDGNTYMYNFNLEIPMDVATDIKYIMRMGAPKDIVEDIIGEECSSLEETKLQAEYDRKMEVANQRKQGVLDLLKSYQQTFESLLKRNQQLPESQVIPHDEFEIDKRIRKDMEAELDSYFQMMHRKIDFIVEKSTLGLHKVQDYFLNSLDSQIITVLSLNNTYKASTFRHRKLDELFLAAKEVVREKLQEMSRLMRDDFKPPTKEVEEELERRKEFSVLSILKGLNTESPEFKQNLRLKKLVQKYYEQKNKVERRQDEWILHNKKKPDPTQNHPDDVAAIEIAEQTIGDFKLKSAVDYIVPKHLRVTTVKKYDELLSCREKLYYIKKDYNDKLYGLRNNKVELINRIKHLHKYIKNIHTEIPDDMIKFPPPVPAIHEDIEFPEREFELKEGESETHTVPQETQVVDEVNATSTTNEVLDVTFEILLTEDNEAARTESSSSSLANLMSRCYTMSTQYDIAKVTELQDDDKQSTSVEEEFKSFRESRKVFEQDQIIKGIYDSLNEFDESVRKLQEEKINVEVDAKLMELHVLTLHHELIIIKKFEATEDALSNKVSAKHAENIEAQNKIQQLQTNIDFRKKEIDNLMEKEAQLLSTLNEALVDEPFADFLRKIYKKKYKAPKVKEDDESDEESSTSEESSEDEDEDLGSIESGEIGPIKLDETICPEGCNRNNYDLAFQLRAKRYAIEQDVAEEKKMIELLRKETESSQKKLKADEAMLKEVQIELEKFQREKQRRLNEVEATVILRLNQLQYFNDLRAPFQKLDDKLLFLNLTLKKLYNRVGELRMETLEQKERHSEVAKQELKDALVYFESLLRNSNRIAAEPSSSINEESMVIGEEMFQNMLQMLAENTLVHDDELIDINEIDDNNAYEDNEMSPIANEYELDEKKKKDTTIFLWITKLELSIWPKNIQAGVSKLYKKRGALV
ncbi:cilia- and flagella-associated protein 44-like [Schistocerca serialis cubense]|uniref:cilia- and flagella-associated protein 44-like n=1 Tax=Schistocerca serialis cubense TaxID=2023355 RepID=UPI00214EE9E8|nr:cilia- and flagella-associated protein 44-like [Schistocerca serialis cubense]